MDRRDFLRNTLVAGGALVGSGYLPMRHLVAAEPDGKPSGSSSASGYGPLVPRKAENTGEPLLAVPEGFRYNVFGRTGSLMSDGRATPGWHDGMAEASYLTAELFRL